MHLVECFRAIFLSGNRRFAVMSAPALVLGLATGATAAAERICLGSIWVPPTWAWIVATLLGLLWAMYLAWLDEYKKGKDLRSELSHELESLDGCPQVILRHDATGFYVVNRGTCDAIDVHLEPIGHGRYLMTSDVVHHLPPTSTGKGEFLSLFGDDESVPCHLTGKGAWDRLADLAWEAHADGPLGFDKDMIAAANQFIAEAKDRILLITVNIKYRDLAGRQFSSPSAVEWIALFSDIGEVRPQPIKRLPKQLLG